MSQAKLEKKDWKFLAQGEHNKVYRSADGLQVLKVQKIKNISDTPERSVRIWNELNPDLPAAVVMLAKDAGTGFSEDTGWICPYIEGKRPSDQEINDGMIDIFNRTGRIVCDAAATAINFIKTPAGRVVCVDVGQALNLNEENNAPSAGTRTRRVSYDSLFTWQGISVELFKCYFPTANRLSPKISKTTQALLFIKKYRPDILNVDFLKQFPDLTEQIVTALHALKRDEVGGKKDQVLAIIDKITSSASQTATASVAASSATASTAASSATASTAASSATASTAASSATASTAASSASASAAASSATASVVASSVATSVVASSVATSVAASSVATSVAASSVATSVAASSVATSVAASSVTTSVAASTANAAASSSGFFKPEKIEQPVQHAAYKYDNSLG